VRSLRTAFNEKGRQTRSPRTVTLDEFRAGQVSEVANAARGTEHFEDDDSAARLPLSRHRAPALYDYHIHALWPSASVPISKRKRQARHLLYSMLSLGTYHSLCFFAGVHSDPTMTKQFGSEEGRGARRGRASILRAFRHWRRPIWTRQPSGEISRHAAAAIERAAEESGQSNSDTLIGR